MESVKIVFLGGVGEVTKNMFVYEYHKDGQLVDSVVVDCGIGFSREGDEIIMPNVSYLLDKTDKLRGAVLTHGHEDHTSGLSELLTKVNVPIYGTRWTIAMAETKLEEHNIDLNSNVVKFDQVIKLGAFEIGFIHITHSIPDAANLIIKTPVGVFYHGADYKFDWSPVDGKQSEVGKIAMAGEAGVLCLLSDCVRSERKGHTLSELAIEDELELEVKGTRGKIFFTTISSNISRIQQAINVAARRNRKVVLMGRSIRQNVELGQKLGYLKIPKKLIIHARQAKKLAPNKAFYIVAGSQAQESSALSRIADESSKDATINPHDKVIFSADPIPGYEMQIGNLINKITRLGADVVYSDINDDLHVSGHGAQHDLMLMLGLTRPQYIIPIGGEPRHVRQYFNLAESMGYKEKNMFAPEEGDAIEFTKNNPPKIHPQVAEV